jgi:hypothetical protein
MTRFGSSCSRQMCSSGGSAAVMSASSTDNTGDSASCIECAFVWCAQVCVCVCVCVCVYVCVCVHVSACGSSSSMRQQHEQSGAQQMRPSNSSRRPHPPAVCAGALAPQAPAPLWPAAAPVPRPGLETPAAAQQTRRRRQRLLLMPGAGRRGEGAATRAGPGATQPACGVCVCVCACVCVCVCVCVRACVYGGVPASRRVGGVARACRARQGCNGV